MKHASLEGMLNERAGFEFVKLGLRVEAECYFERALHIYEHNWGAIAKYNQLRKTSLQALEQDRDIAASGLLGTSISVPLKSWHQKK